MRLPFKIVKNPRICKKERKLKLTLFYTFPSGENIYTYDTSDLVHLSGRYIDKVKQDLSFLMEYGASKKQVEVYEEKAYDIICSALNGTRNQGEALADLKKQFEERKILYKYNKDLNRQLWLDLYCFFFVLDDEDEIAFSPKSNSKKIELLETLPDEEQEFFFRTLEGIMTYYSDTFNQDIQVFMNQKKKELEVMGYTTELIDKLNSTLNYVGGQI